MKFNTEILKILFLNNFDVKCLIRKQFDIKIFIHKIFLNKLKILFSFKKLKL